VRSTSYEVPHYAILGIRLLGKPILGWQDNIKMHLKEIGKEVVYWDYVSKGRDYWGTLLNTVMNFRVP
jgi:hypothetical protein